MVCVDDSPDVLELLQITLEREPDFEVTALGQDHDTDLLKLLLAHQADAVVLDHTTTKPSSGQELAPGDPDLVAALRAAAPHMVIVVFTGWTDIEETLVAAGADAVVSKPNSVRVVPAIRSAVARRHAERE